MKKPFQFPSRMIAEEARPLHYEKLIRDVLSKEECERLLETYKDDSLYEPGLVSTGGEYEHKPDIRLVKVLNITDEMQPQLYDVITAAVKKANDELFQFDLYGMWDDFVLGHYQSDNGEDGCSHFTWHSDIGGGTSAYRKLSVIVALSNPDDYLGGEFEVFYSGIKSYRLPQGSMMIFPSYMPHRVKAVIYGSRKVLINFAVGPRFR